MIFISLLCDMYETLLLVLCLYLFNCFHKHDSMFLLAVRSGGGHQMNKEFPPCCGVGKIKYVY